MRGHLRKRGKAYSIVIERPRSPKLDDAGNPVLGLDGKVVTVRRQEWIPTGLTDKRLAERKLTEVLASLDGGTYVERSNQTLSGYVLEEWLSAIVDTVRPSTFHSYRRNLTLHVLPQLGERKLIEIDGGSLNALYASLRSTGRHTKAGGGLSPRSVAYVHTILHRAFKDAVAWNRLTRNPCDAARPPKASATEGSRREMTTWSGAEVAAFLGKALEADDRYRPAWLTLATTGLRRGELLGLRWADLDLDAGRAQVRQTILCVVVDGKRQVIKGTPKTAHGQRSIALDAVTVTALRALRKEQLEDRLAFGAGYGRHEFGELVFCHADGQPYHPERFSREFDRRVKRWGLPKIRLHDLRHTHATMALEAGIHPRVVQERLGHANIGITLGTYSHVNPAMDASAAETIAAAIFGGPSS